MKYELSLSKYSNEITLGTIKDKKVYDFLKQKKLENGFLDRFYYAEDENDLDEDMDLIYYDDILHTTLIRNDFTDIDLSYENEEGEKVHIDINEKNIFYYRSDSSYFEKAREIQDAEIQKKDKDVFAFCGVVQVFKGDWIEFFIETDDFKIENLRFIYDDFDFINGISVDDLIEYILYISDEELCKLYNEKYLVRNNLSEDRRIFVGDCDFRDCIGDMILESVGEEFKEFFDGFVVEWEMQDNGSGVDSVVTLIELGKI